MLSGDERDRTANLLVANQALSQLSYVPMFRCRQCSVALGAGIGGAECLMIASTPLVRQLVFVIDRLVRADRGGFGTDGGYIDAACGIR